jgi:hypothetical protein
MVAVAPLATPARIYNRGTSPPRRRLGVRSIGSLLVIRFLLIGNGAVLLAIGVLYVVYGGRPGGLVVGAVLVSASLALFGCVPLTDPYRQRPRR